MSGVTPEGKTGASQLMHVPSNAFLGQTETNTLEHSDKVCNVFVFVSAFGFLALIRDVVRHSLPPTTSLH